MTFSSRRNKWRAFALVAGMLSGGLLVPEPSAASDGLRCGTQLVQEGDSQYEVKKLCGAPDDVQQRTESRRVQRAVQRPCAHGSGSCVVVVDDYVEVVVHEWVYDFGPRRFLQYLTFEGGQLVDVRSGSYGHKL
jgi:hypothetical protein